MIISGGLNVYPAEVEMVLESHPSVAEAAVAGVPDERWGEQVTAWVVMRPGCAFDERALIAHARTRLTAYKCPKQVVELKGPAAQSHRQGRPRRPGPFNSMIK
jgi:acyl-CoA synthetase (AMP-forming)/AMP-acid ligase II